MRWSRHAAVLHRAAPCRAVPLAVPHRALSSVAPCYRPCAIVDWAGQGGAQVPGARLGLLGRGRPHPRKDLRRARQGELHAEREMVPTHRLHCRATERAAYRVRMRTTCACGRVRVRACLRLRAHLRARCARQGTDPPHGLGVLSLPADPRQGCAGHALINPVLQHTTRRCIVYCAATCAALFGHYLQVRVVCSRPDRCCFV